MTNHNCKITLNIACFKWNIIINIKEYQFLNGILFYDAIAVVLCGDLWFGSLSQVIWRFSGGHGGGSYGERCSRYDEYGAGGGYGGYHGVQGT